jgi:hypothetical protein
MRPIPRRGGALPGSGGEAGGAAVEIVLEDLDQRRFDRDPAVFAALAAHVDDSAVLGPAKVTDVGAQQFISAQAGQQRGQDEGAIPLEPVGAARALRLLTEDDQQCGHRICRQRLR